jgi:hypothetical protein
VRCAALACRINFGASPVEIGRDFLLERIKNNWLSNIRPLDPEDCSATCLFAVQFGDGLIHFGMLGDGLVAVIKTDGSIVSTTEDKDCSFSNITSTLSSNVSPKDWRYFSLPEEGCIAVLLCTDGVADDLDDVDGFVSGFLEGLFSVAKMTANRRTRQMLEKWPTPKHNDDKTIACLIRQDLSDAWPR